MRYNRNNGYTLVELIIAVGLFALIMTLAAGAYLMMISINRQTQGITSGIDNVSFAIETITRTIRTSTNYSCGATAGSGQDCPVSGGGTFSVTNSAASSVTYTTNGEVITQAINNGTAMPLTDSSVAISSMKFYSTGAKAYSTDNTDKTQSRVTIVISGTVSAGPGKTVPFTVETGATMRGSDI